MTYKIENPADLAGENFPLIFQELYSDGALDEAAPRVNERRENYRHVFGVAPADEYILLTLLLNQAISPEKMYPGDDPGDMEGLFFESEECYLMDQLSDVDGLREAEDLAPYFAKYDFLLTLLTGTERIGSDPSGDGFLIHMFGEGDSHAVYRYEHDYGTIEGVLSGSIASFFVDFQGVGSDYQDDDDDFIAYPFAASPEQKKAIRTVLETFDKSAAATRAQGPFQHDPGRLFKRIHWILQHTTGKPTYDFASYMKHAPDYEVWQNEREIISSEPVIANYWLLAHFFLKNHGALRETARLAADSPSRVTRFLAEAVLQAAENDGSLLTLGGETTQRLINDTCRNADMKLFEPDRRAQMSEARGQDKIDRLPASELDDMEGDVDALWDALEKYPDDIEGHDKILEALAEADENLKEVVDDYFDERTSEAYNEWPADWRLEDDDFNFDPRLSPVIAAAFISGLGFNAENEKAFSGLTHALSIFDDDYSMRAYEKAIESLAPEDDRGEYLFLNLKRSKHPRASELITKGARRFFDIMREAIRQEEEQAAERERDGITLDNMWDTENFFHIPLRACLERRDVVAEEIAREILKEPRLFNAFKLNLGRAFRVMGERGVGDFNEAMVRMLEWVREQAVEKDSSFGPVMLMSLAEAGIALAKLDPEKARELLPDMFYRETAGRYFDLDMKAALLGGMFILREGHASETAGLTEWLERLLGNRDNHERLIAALRAAEAAALPESFAWVRHHLYSDVNSFMGHHALIKDMAFAAAEALGHADLPRFNDEDEYANAVPVAELPAAMGRPHLHDIEHVLKRMFEEKYSNPDALEPVRAYLLDVLRFSGDDDGRTFDGQWPAFQALSPHGRAAQHVFRDVLDLEYCRNGVKNDAVFYMRILEGEAPFAVWLMEQSREDVLRLLESPDARALTHLDMLAARACLLDAKAAGAALEKTMRFRYRWRGGHFAEEDPALVNLPRIFALFGESPVTLLRELIDGIDPLGEYGLSHTREYLETALKNKPTFTPRDKSPKALEMKCSLRGEGWMNGKKTLKLKRKGGTIAIDHISHELDFRGTLQGGGHKSTAEWKLDDEEAAARGMDSLVNVFALLGYQAVATREDR